MLLPLPLDIWLSLALAGLTVSDCDLSLLLACVSVLLGDQRRDLSMAVLPILCPEGSGQVPPVLPVLTGMSALQCYPHYPCGI